MDITEPSRLPSLGPRAITILSHLDETRMVKLDDSRFTAIFPFETLFSLKQHIAVTLKTSPPNQLYIAMEIGPNQFRPLEFSWPFLGDKGLPNPHDPAVLRQPDSRIYEDDAKKPVYPTIYSGVTLENTLLVAQPEQPTIHVWTLESLLRPDQPLDEPVFEGFVKLYFPQLRSQPTSLRMSTADLQTLSEYRTYMDTRLSRLETGVISDIVKDAELPELTKLYIYKSILPKAPNYNSSLLELKFYEMIPTPSKPFLRYFSAKDRVPSIIKVATARDGKPYITNEKLLDSLMADKPSTDMGAIILIKRPIDDPKVLGICWTVRIYEDGSAEMYIGAPRRGVSVSAKTVNAAQSVLRDMLAGTPWENIEPASIKLCDLTAEYEFTTNLGGRKPGKVELVNRVDTFTPLFSIDPPFEDETPQAALILRYKGVSNYVQYSNPIMNYLTLLYLNRGSKTEVDVPRGAYIKALVKEFGISLEEATQAEEDWIQRHSTHVIMYKSGKGDDLRIKDLAIRDARCSVKNPPTTEEDTTVAAYNVGAAIRLYNDHPKYRILITGCESTRDLERMLTLMTLFLSESTETLKVDKTAKAEEAVAATEADIAEAAPEVPEELNQAFDYGLLDMMQNQANNDAAEEDEAEEEAEEEEVTKPSAVAVPTALAPDETVEAITKEWYLNKLKSRDNDLFQYTDTSEARTKLYSRQCQLTQNRQPNVLSKEAYRRAKELYGDKVRWLEVPLKPDVQKAYDVAVSKTVGQRKGKGTNKQIAEMEMLILRKGFALKADGEGRRSITEVDSSLKEEKAIIDGLIAEQESKPVWLVTQTGTDAKHINNYICTEFWCVRDDLPLLEAEFNGTVGYDGKPKAAKSCPFCRGTVIRNNAKPAIGETVLQRPTSAASGKVAKYSGFLSGLFHPDKYALPCCFVEQKHVAPPEGAKLPELPSTEEAAPSASAPAPVPLPGSAPTAAQPVKDIVNRSKPFSPNAKTWYIPNQNILGRIKLDWFELEKGAIAVPPASVNRFIGQNPEDFLTKNRGVEQQETNSHLLPYRDNTTPAQAFVRYGLGHSQREPGKNFLALLAWAEYATEEFAQHNDGNTIKTEEQVLDVLLDKLNGANEPFAARAFEQANYGTLIHEFANRSGAEAPTGAIQEWCGKMGLLPTDGGEISAAAKQFYFAWHRFKEYVADTKEPKELRLWESLLAVPGLFTEHGVLLVRIRVPKNKNEDPVLLCPHFGISVHNKIYPPPFLLLVEDEVTANYDPLVLYDGKTLMDKKMYGVIHFQAAGSIETLPPKVRVPLQTFVEEYVSETGCGRSVPPVHPWLPVRSMEFKPPSITDLNSIKNPDIITPDTHLLRDRSNRLVGIIDVQTDKTKLYVPCVDDGLILPQCASMYGEESLLPPPTLQTVFTSMPKIESLMPKAFRINGKKTQYTAVDLVCGITIPIAPISVEDPVLNEPAYAKLKAESPLILKEGTEPWLADLALMAPKAPVKSLETATKEEELEEAYQHLRITLSEFLAGQFKSPADQQSGRVLKAKIDKLRQARRRLPLFELQRRLDSLLYPYVNQWVKRDDNRVAAKPSVLRRECTQITKQSDCIEGCSWTEGEAPLRQCLIHTTATERFLDPVHLMSARLTDELLRTFGKAMEILNHTVSRLKPLQGSEFRYENGSLLFSAVGRGTQLLYDILGYSKRQPTDYTAGLTYPEEVGINELAIELPEDWKESLYRIVVSPYLAGDPRAFLNQVMRIAKFIPADKSFHGTQKEWIELAKELNVNVLRTYYNSETNRIDISQSDSIIESKADVPNYIVLDVNGVPLQNKKTTGFTLREDELPASIQMALD